MALTQASKEAMWIRSLLSDLGEVQDGPTTLYGDNQGSLALGNNPTHHSRSKHIDIRHHFIREAVQDGKIILEYCNTDEMLADYLTKALPREKFIKLRDLTGMCRADAQ
jgi:hypothetical protein